MKTYLTALGGAVLVVGLFEWRTDEDAVTLLALLAASGLLGAARPRRFWLSGLTLGLVVPVLNLLEALTGLRPIYETAAQAGRHGAFFALTLLPLVIPAVIAAAMGAAARRLTDPASGAPVISPRRRQ